MDMFVADINSTNIYLCRFSGKNCMIDCGGRPEHTIQTLRELRFEPEYVLLTHGHYDHISALNAVWETYHPIVALSEADRCFLTDAKYNLSYAFSSTPFIFSGECKDIWEVAPDLGITVLETPGHTPGSVTIVYDNIAYTGDTLFRGDVGSTRFPLGDEDAERQSVLHLLHLPDDMVIKPGHGPDSTIARERRLYI